MGKKNAQEYEGFCPLHVQDPFGKTLKVSFIGFAPYIIYNPLGGTEFVTTQILAKKFGFIPKFIPAKTTYGMVQQVRVFLKMQTNL